MQALEGVLAGRSRSSEPKEKRDRAPLAPLASSPSSGQEETAEDHPLVRIMFLRPRQSLFCLSVRFPQTSKNRATQIPPEDRQGPKKTLPDNERQAGMAQREQLGAARSQKKKVEGGNRMNLGENGLFTISVSRSKQKNGHCRRNVRWS